MAEFALLRVRLTPRGGRSALIKFEEGVLFARVAAPPIDGEANRALIALLSDTLRVPKSRILFAGGETSREKTLRFEGVSPEALQAQIDAALSRK